MEVCVKIPGIKLVTPNITFRNASMFSRMKTAKIAAKQRSDVSIVLSRFMKPRLPVLITITRFGKGSLDSHDNLAMSAKHVSDAVAQWLGVDDSDRRLEWNFADCNGNYAVGIRIQEKCTTKTELERCKIQLANAIKAARLWKTKASEGGARSRG